MIICTNQPFYDLLSTTLLVLFSKFTQISSNIIYIFISIFLQAPVQALESSWPGPLEILATGTDLEGHLAHLFEN